MFLFLTALPSLFTTRVLFYASGAHLFAYRSIFWEQIVPGFLFVPKQGLIQLNVSETLIDSTIQLSCSALPSPLPSMKWKKCKQEERMIIINVQLV